MLLQTIWSKYHICVSNIEELHVLFYLTWSDYVIMCILFYMFFDLTNYATKHIK